jgi:hypothetical protein
LVLVVVVEHFDVHGDVPFEFLGDEVEFDALGQGFEQFPFEIVLLFLPLELLVFVILYLLSVVLNLHFESFGLLHLFLFLLLDALNFL